MSYFGILTNKAIKDYGACDKYQQIISIVSLEFLKAAAVLCLPCLLCSLCSVQIVVKYFEI